MEINGMGHRAAWVILEMNFNSITNAHAEERTRDFAIERPVGESGAVCELPDHFHSFKIDPHIGGSAVTNWTWEINRIAGNISTRSRCAAGGSRHIHGWHGSCSTGGV